MGLRQLGWGGKEHGKSWERKQQMLEDSLEKVGVRSGTVEEKGCAHRVTVYLTNTEMIRFLLV